jgi:ubiquitin C-terminal hydrolase
VRGDGRQHQDLGRIIPLEEEGGNPKSWVKRRKVWKDFGPWFHKYKNGDKVICETDWGRDVGTILSSPQVEVKGRVVKGRVPLYRVHFPGSGKLLSFIFNESNIQDYQEPRLGMGDKVVFASNFLEASSTIVLGRAKKSPHIALAGPWNGSYLNSTLHCLAHTEPLRDHFLSGEYERDLNRDNPMGTGRDLATQFAQLLGELWIDQESDFPSSSSVVYSRNFKDSLGRYAKQFSGNDSRDAYECASAILVALHEDTNRVSEKRFIGDEMEKRKDESDEDAANRTLALCLERDDSKVGEIFTGQLKSRIQCVCCGRFSTQFHSFMNLSVRIPENGSQSVTLLDCLAHFGRIERFFGSSYCEGCRCNVRKSRQLTVSRSPPILIIRLVSGSKNHAHVDFPLQGLDLTQHVSNWTDDERPVYDCYAVTNDYTQGNHDAYALNEDGTWCNYDHGEITSNLDTNKVVSEAAYVLYYRRRTFPAGEDFVASLQTPGCSSHEWLEGTIKRIDCLGRSDLRSLSS